MEYLRGISEGLRRALLRRRACDERDDMGTLVGVEGLVCLREALKSHFFSFCYRYGMPPLGGTSITSDSGWGCMHRSAAMLLARVLTLLLFVSPQESLSLENFKTLRMFMDDEVSSNSGFRPYSLHAMLATKLTHAGAWIGPAKASRILKTIVHSDSARANKEEAERQSCADSRLEHPDSKLAVVVADQAVYVDAVAAEYTARQQQLLGTATPSEPGPLLLLVSLRLGLTSVNEMFHTRLREALREPHCVGFLGGLPSRALYIVGLTSSSEHFVAIDPHYPLPFHDQISEPFPSKELLEQVCDDDVELLDASSLDASLVAAFLFNNYEGFSEWAVSRQIQGASGAPRVELIPVHDRCPDVCDRLYFAGGKDGQEGNAAPDSVPENAARTGERCDCGSGVREGADAEMGKNYEVETDVGVVAEEDEDGFIFV